MFHKIEFIKSATEINNYPSPDKKEFCIVGKSNVGKSSFINKITNRKSISKVGKTPGKTKLLNYFLVNDLYYMVDTPGYGYANLSKSEQNRIEKMIIEYFEKRANLELIVLLVDIRRLMGEHEQWFLNLIKEKNIGIIIVFTKTDKLSKNQLYNQKQKIKNANVGIFNCFASTTTTDWIVPLTEKIVNILEA